METKYITITMKPEHRARVRRSRWSWKPVSQAAGLFLAAMAAARLVLLALDIAQSRLGTFGGEILIPAYAAIFIYAGWTLKSLAYEWKGGKRKCTTTNVSAVGATWTRGKGAIASRKTSERRSA